MRRQRERRQRGKKKTYDTRCEPTALSDSRSVLEEQEGDRSEYEGDTADEG